MVQAGRDAETGEFRAPAAQPRGKQAQGLVLLTGDAARRADRLLGRGIGQQPLELAGDAAGAQVGQAEAEQVAGVLRQAELKPGVAAQSGMPGPGIPGPRLLLAQLPVSRHM